MPNGESRNWIRFLSTLEGYFALYGKWPTSIRLYSFFIKELQEKLSDEDFHRLQEKIKLIPDDDNPFLSSDEAGRTYDYSRQACPENELKANEKTKKEILNRLTLTLGT